MTRARFPLLVFPLGLGFLGPLNTIHASAAYLDNSGVFTTINLPATNPVPVAINDSGEILAAGFVYAGGIATPISYPASVLTTPFGIDDAGEVVGYYVGLVNPQPQGFTYANGAYSTVDYPGSTATELLAISSSGTILGRYFNTACPLSCLFLDSNGTFTTPSSPTGGGAIDNAGDILDGNTVYYSNGVVVPINVPGASSTTLFGINDLGQIVGTALFGNGPDMTSEGFVYTNGVFQFINFPGAPPGTTTAYAINNADEIVGTYGAFTPIVPEPASLALVAAGLAGIAVIKHRRCHSR